MSDLEDLDDNFLLTVYSCGYLKLLVFYGTCRFFFKDLLFLVTPIIPLSNIGGTSLSYPRYGGD
jgi:hypothetical protein